MRDGHVHTPFCPHGTKDSLEQYAEMAIEQGITELTFTEHAPLPQGFTDPTPAQDSSMTLEELPFYLDQVKKIQEKYAHHILIHCGLEVDYIEGFEREITEFLDHYGSHLSDSILSVHFLKHGDDYDCLDYSPDAFREMVEKYGSIEAVYEAYFRTLKRSVEVPLGIYKPKRIGHITLAHKFQKKYPCQKRFDKEIYDILAIMKKTGYELDYNGAGLAKPLCREPYPPQWVMEIVQELQVPYVYGSDAHQAKELLQGYTQLPYLH